ncbi:conserved hypothetical protein [Mesorhizobium prunaredense]|uniref:Uncharacterized protein n=1 Tax=Mesorhizobium prunaredense TaxID=1631249 RepID=A0A1R3VIA2_9HYPH|nr:heparinase II/III family protein [Mesorhizobium prunaredense]SIT58129.1 conserved hypothetical protein [Mesorhizobium prunaredense]
MGGIGRYFHTLKHLRLIQIYGRVLFRMHHPKPDLARAPQLRAHEGSFAEPAHRRPSMTAPNEFIFLNRPGSLAFGWDAPCLAKLWRYNLHYFDDLSAVASGERKEWHKALIERWIAGNPPSAGSGWEPYPVSLRIVNWIKWALAGNDLSPAAIHSLAVQVRWLTKRLEYHLLGNHLFANAKALVFAGAFFEGAEANAWLERGLSILERVIDEQILSDGGHFELSTMYHALALEDVLDLVNITRAFNVGDDVSKELVLRVPAMRRWLAAMCHPDGDIAFFNDAAKGIAPLPAELNAYAERLGFGAVQDPGRGLVRLDRSGYARFADDRMTTIIDVARIGPDYLPGHAHADTLSFEMSLDGHRILVNSGTSEYGAGPERLRQRGTPAHNTVTVDNADSSEVWGGFRVAQRARPIAIDIVEAGASVSIRASHDGYRRLAGRPVHVRHFEAGTAHLRINDKITGPVREAQARYHFVPGVELRPNGVGGQAIVKGRSVLNWVLEKGEGDIVSATYHPEFGISQPSFCLVVKAVENCAIIRFEGIPLSTS